MSGPDPRPARIAATSGEVGDRAPTSVPHRYHLPGQRRHPAWTAWARAAASTTTTPEFVVSGSAQSQQARRRSRADAIPPGSATVAPCRGPLSGSAHHATDSTNPESGNPGRCGGAPSVRAAACLPWMSAETRGRRPDVDKLSRRRFIAAGLGAVGAVAVGGTLIDQAWPLLAREDLIPGRAPHATLEPDAWETTPDRLSFAAIGDNGSGGRQAMAVAERMALAYQSTPFGLVTLLGDICYYGKIRDRFDDVFVEPMSPLIDAGVRFELAIGNHDGDLHHSGTCPSRRSRTSSPSSARPPATTPPPTGRWTSSTWTPARPDSSAPSPPPSSTGRRGARLVGQPVEGGVPPPPPVLLGAQRLHPRGGGQALTDPRPSRRRPRARRPRPPLRADGAHRRHDLRGERWRLQDHRCAAQSLHRRGRVDPRAHAIRGGR